MVLTSLPTELLLHIYSYLPNETLEILAQTFNRRITYLCLHEISQWLKTQRNARRMNSAFAEPRKAYIHGVPGAVRALWRRFELDSEYGSCAAASNSHHVDLKDTLHFLPPLDQPSFEHGPLPFSCRHFRSINIDKLQTQAARLGLQIPESFLRLVREISTHADLFANDEENANQFYLDENPLLKVSYTVRRNGSSQTVDWGDMLEDQHPRTADAIDDVESLEERHAFMQAPELTLNTTLAPNHAPSERVSSWKTISSDVDNDTDVTHVEGYLLPFYTDIHGAYSWSLFLDNGRSGPAHMRLGNPGHCVIGTGELVGPPNDFKDYEDVEMEVEVEADAEAEAPGHYDLDMDSDTDTESYMDSDLESDAESSSSCSSPATPISAFRELPLPTKKSFPDPATLESPFHTSKPTILSKPHSSHIALTPLERSLGIRPVAPPSHRGALTLVDTSFEQWFAKTYYDALAWATYYEGRKEMDAGLRTWLGGVYGKDSREVVS